MHNNINV